jgi:hypothetical protein
MRITAVKLPALAPKGKEGTQIWLQLVSYCHSTYSLNFQMLKIFIESD